MVKLLVKKLHKCYPELLPDFKMSEGMHYDQIVKIPEFIMPNAPAQTGCVEVLFDEFEGNISEVSELLILEDEPLKCYIEEYHISDAGQLSLKLRFNTVFLNDFKRFSKSLFVKNRGIIGFSEKELKHFRQSENQRELLAELLSFIFPWKKDVILPLAKNSSLLIQDDDTAMPACWFNATETEDPDNTKDGLFHVCRLSGKAFKVLSEYEFQQNEYIDIFIDIQNTENHWPYKKDEFKVAVTRNEIGGSPFKKSLTFKSIQLLDLPDSGHSVFASLKFKEAEEFRYEGIDNLMNFLLVEHIVWGEITKIGAYSDAVQSCVLEELRYRMSQVEIPGANVLTKNWTLLLQLTPNVVKTPFYEKFGYGSIYFLIPEDDLKIGNFDNVEIVVQGT